MSGDYTRFTYKPGNRYAGVLMQQGRVQLDADWNEEVEIVKRRRQVQATDTFGPCAVPKLTTPDGFKITHFTNSEGDLDLLIGEGRIYVDGLLAEIFKGEQYNEADISYLNQPYYPVPPDLPTSDANIYLDVWERELTYIEEPELLEKALGGPDTATRIQTVWQVKFEEVESASCGAPMPPPSGGLLCSRAIGTPKSDDPCELSQSGGYRGLENRLYRVEVHTGGDLNSAKFKWSRENASVVSAVEDITTTGSQSTLKVSRIGRDKVLRFRVDDWVEVLDDHRELMNEPGFMAQVTDVKEASRTILLDRALPTGTGDYEFDPNKLDQRHTRVRRWDQQHDIDGDGLVAVSNSWIPIEDGVEVNFDLVDTSDPGCEFKVGDFWCFWARTADGSVEELKKVPPRGIIHHYCQLATLTFSGDDPEVHDCRPLWPDACCCCTIEVGDGKISHGDYNNIARAVKAALDRPHNEYIRICLLPGKHLIPHTIPIDRDHVTLVGCGRASKVVAKNTAFEISGNDVTLENFVLEINLEKRIRPGGLDGHEAIKKRKVVPPAILWIGSKKEQVKEGRIRALEVENSRGPGIMTEYVSNFAALENSIEAIPAISMHGWDLSVLHNRFTVGGLEIQDGSGCVRVAGNCITEGNGNGITIGTRREVERTEENRNGITAGIRRIAERSEFLEEIVLERNHISGMSGSGISAASGGQASRVDFSKYQPETTGPNPWEEDGVEFRVLDPSGALVDKTLITMIEELIGFDCGNHTEINMDSPSSSVELTLVSFSGPVDIIPISASGDTGPTVVAGVEYGEVETVRLKGEDIVQVKINALKNRALLLSFGFDQSTYIQGLSVIENEIIGCVTPRTKATRTSRLRSDLPLGGIVMAGAQHLLIRDNRIEDNGAAQTTNPVTGIFLRNCKGVVIRDNRVVNNGLPPNAERMNGFQGGIVAHDLSVVVEEMKVKVTDSDFPDDTLPPDGPTTRVSTDANFSREDGWPAAVIHGNLVVAPRGLALDLRGMGPMQVTDNRLVSKGLSGTYRKAQGDVMPWEYYCRAVLIGNIGLPSYMTRWLMGNGFAAPTAPIAGTMPLDVPQSETFAISGKVEFSNNQVVLNLIPYPNESIPAAVGIGTLDDLAMHDNQIECHLADGFSMTFGTVAFGLTTARITGNGFTESPTSTPISLIGYGVVCTGADNQGTHCIIIEGSTADLTKVHHNLGVLCVKAFPEFSYLAIVDGT